MLCDFMKEALSLFLWSLHRMNHLDPHLPTLTSPPHPTPPSVPSLYVFAQSSPQLFFSLKTVRKMSKNNFLPNRSGSLFSALDLQNNKKLLEVWKRSQLTRLPRKRSSHLQANLFKLDRSGVECKCRYDIHTTKCCWNKSQRPYMQYLQRDDTAPLAARGLLVCCEWRCDEYRYAVESVWDWPSVKWMEKCDCVTLTHLQENAETNLFQVNNLSISMQTESSLRM